MIYEVFVVCSYLTIRTGVSGWRRVGRQGPCPLVEADPVEHVWKAEADLKNDFNGATLQCRL
jgi:hypothetical protein